MFYNNIDPVLLTIGPFEIRYYGIVYVFGFLLCWFLLDRYRRIGEIQLSSEGIQDLMLYMILGVIIGSRVFHVLFWNPVYYFSNPLEVFMLWKGGMAFHGGLVGVLVASWLFCRNNNLSLWKLADLIAVPSLFALALGRLANYANSELYGPVTDVAWCVHFRNAEGCRHPYQIYSFLKRLLVVGWLAFLLSIKKTRKFRDGFIFWNLILLVNLGRFIIDFWREDARFLGLAAGQIIALVIFVIGLVVLLKRHKDDFLKLVG